MAQLGEGQGGEDHRLPDLWRNLRVPQARRQRHERHQHPYPEDVAAKASGEDALPRRTRRTAHDTPLGRLRAQGQGGRTVGNEVDPEYLQRQERKPQTQEGTDEHYQDLGRVARKQVLYEFADVVVDDPALLHRGDDGRKVVVGQDHISSLFGDVGARYAHRHDDMAFLLQGFHYVELVLRRDPRVDRHLLNEVHEILPRQASEISLRQDAPLLGDAELGRDVPGGQGMVASDHHRSDARSLAGLYGILGLRPGRIDHTNHSQEGEVTLELFPYTIDRLQTPQPHAQDADAVPCQLLVCGRDPLSPSFRQRLVLPVVGPNLARDLQQAVHGTLGENDVGGTPLFHIKDGLRDLQGL